MTLDCSGMRCPLPIIELARGLSELAVGDEIELISDDPAADVDVAAWCRMTGQELVASAPQGSGSADARAYRIRRLV